MNIFKFFVAAIMIGSTITVSAANTSEPTDSIKNESPEKAYYQWKILYQKCVNNYDSYITLAQNDEKKLKKLKMTKDDFNSYKDLCSKLDSSITLMKNKNDFNSTIDFDISKWDALSLKFKGAIKSDIKDLDKNSDETWEKYCDNLKAYYIELNKEYDASKLNYVKQIISKNKEQENEIKALNDTITCLRGIEKEYKSIKKQKESTISNLDEVFRACVFFPLAVKYDANYTPLAYQAALGMYNNPHIPKNTQVIKEWKNYEELLKNYNKYNDSVIKFIETIQSKLTQKEAKPIDVNYYKQVFVQEYYAYSEYYNKTVSISYLDNVLNEFFALLDDYAKKGTKPSEKFFSNFIINNLGSNYGQK